MVSSLAGPKRPQDRISLTDAKPAFRRALAGYVPTSNGQDEAVAATFPASDPTASQEPSNGEGARAAHAQASGADEAGTPRASGTSAAGAPRASGAGAAGIPRAGKEEEEEEGGQWSRCPTAPRPPSATATW